MALGADIISKQVTVLQADTKQFQAEMKAAGAVEDKVMKDRLAGMERYNQALDRGSKQLGLYAAGAAAAWAIVSSSVKKYEQHLVSLGSKGEGELKRLRDVTGSLTKAQDNLQHAIAKVALEAGPAAKALGEMANELANIVGGVAAVVRAAKDLPGAGYVGSAFNLASKVNPITGSALLVREGARRGGIGGLADSIGGAFYDGNVPGLDPNYSWWDRHQMRQYELGRREDERKQRALDESTARMHLNNLAARGQGALGRVGRGLGIGTETGGGRRGGRGDSGPSMFDEAQWFAEGLIRQKQYQDMLAAEQQQGRDAYRKGTQLSITDRNDIRSSAQEATEAARGHQIEESIRKAKELQGSIDQRESMLESIFGPVEDFEIYTTAWQGLESVVTTGFDAWISGSKGVGEAMKEALHGFAKQLAGEALLQALRHTAYGIGSLALGGPFAGASAGAHFKAAAAWGAVAVSAGVIGKASAPSTGSASAGAGTARGNSYAAAGLGGSSSGGGSNQAPTYILLGDHYGYESERSRNQRFRSALHTAGRGGSPAQGVQHS